MITPAAPSGAQARPLVAMVVTALLGTSQPVLAEALQLDGTPLMSSDGRELRFSAELFEADATIVSFTFTGCESVCPVSDLVMEGLAMRVSASGREIGLLTFTIDPLGDNEDVLEMHRQGVGGAANRTWITGDPRNVWRVLDKLGMPAGGDLAEHPAFYLAVSRGGVSSLRINEEQASFEVLLKGAAVVAQEAE